MSVERLNECYREGKKANKDGTDLHANPYHYETREHDSWQTGWLDNLVDESKRQPAPKPIEDE